ncbi:DUF3310 domain-containing protein [Staphylococcus epidermidis]|nr:DUF3310 domain-containing protein [Staphylococcus epidermidis]MDH8723476.1 DUF3310 domain-containing protein [Staphylococcus epidermidis]MDH8746625.1 DUF3310 domain-containing protein [Staphylococcus epidermidis]MDH8757470.1 DUF3310 domain-containing protein [Staphylococcus epidermidis]MDH8837117.1 DUF3310 domain-containing protein [Staphylococcus epidermidis]MDH8934462.1 DUF3310 domain-containing protein [Staphylococcus epidermidis]
MSIKDLIIGDRIRIQEVNGVEITVQIKNVYRLVQSSLDMDKWVADVEAIDGRTWTIDDCYDFYSLPNGNEGTKKTLDDKVNHPSHYTYGDMEVIDYCDQVCKQYSPELAPYVFNAIKYLSRANHKGGREDIGKAKYYVQRLFDKWEG